MKVWPLALVPLFLVEAKRRRVDVAAASAPAIVALAALAAPYWTDVWENMRHMSGFVGGWRNNDSAFGLTLWFTGDLYRAKYVTFAAIAAVIGVLSFLKVRLTTKVLVVTVAMLALSANCHPWYATWFLPLLAVEPFVPLFVWAALMPIAYDVVTEWRILGQWNGLTPLRWYVHAPFYVLLTTYWMRLVRYNRGRCDRRELRHT